MADVAITGLGLVTPAGIGVDDNWSAICAGTPTAELDPLLQDPSPYISSRVRNFDAEALLGARRALRLDPFVQFALVAAREAIADAGLTPGNWDGARIGVVLGTAHGGVTTAEEQHGVLMSEGSSWVSPNLLPMQLPNMLAGQVAIEFGVTGPNLVVSTACASGATAIGIARDLIALNRCDIVLAGGSEAMITPLIMAGFARMGALSRRTDDPKSASRPFDVDRDGFVAAEGAGVVVLEHPSHARARGAHVHGRLVGYGATADAYHMTAPRPDGRGIEAAVRAALDDASARIGDVDHVNAHGTSTPLNDRTEAAMLKRTFPGDPLISSTKGVTGHLLGAAGAVEAIYTVLAVEHGVAPPTANLATLDPEIDIKVATCLTPMKIDLALSNSFGFGGQNAVLAIATA
ncbi:beta-ketoacyl-[acyl-carrier-protein] synthase family protein [Streptomyces sp. NPDC005065]|uniref:beta-ketoacyl-[acyl-carrier-protein] synthase family protein n=1 Tax=unclassified Streptomyces TaxID=2593676 RepID=UPI0033B28ABD